MTDGKKLQDKRIGKREIQLINAVSHLFVDTVCAALIFSAVSQTGEAAVGVSGTAAAAAVLVYNTIAFTGQCVAGALLDIGGEYKAFQSAAMLLTAIAVQLPIGIVWRAALAGLGNCMFHVCAGTVTLTGSKGKAADLGVFVAPGAIGVCIGSLRPEIMNLAAASTAVMSVVVLFAYKLCSRTERVKSAAPTGEFDVAATVLIVLAVMVRAIGGSAVEFTWKNSAADAAILAAAVFAGKFTGGFLSDKIGVKRLAVISIPIAAICTAFLAANPVTSCVGQFAINLTMPVTLLLIYREMPDRPGLAFGLTAAALWSGTLAGGAIVVSETGRSLYIILCLIFGLAAILYCCRKDEGRK